jgi:putative oxidoreductase
MATPVPSPEGELLQRLFSTFANGWPGTGLFIQRLVIGTALLYRGVVQLQAPAAGLTIPSIAAAILGLFILLGLWTPLMGALVALAQIWILVAGAGDISTPLLLGTFGGTVAMIGPGAWSIDARLFGRKHLGS